MDCPNPNCTETDIPVKIGWKKIKLGAWDQRKRKCPACGCEFFTHEEVTPGQKFDGYRKGVVSMNMTNDSR